jgi:two-component system LytT family response regulator
MIKAVIISGDAEATATSVRAVTEFCPNVSISGDADAVKAGVALVNSVQPDIVILDTRLKDGSGFDFLKHFEQAPFRVIFISTHIEYALKAFKASAVDFILKPPDPNELAQAVNKAVDLITNEEKLRFSALAENIRNLNKKEKIILKTFDHIYIVNQEDIVRLEADGSYSTFYVADGRKIIISKPIRDFEEQLNVKSFYRIHKSHIINIGKVSHFDKTEGGYVVMSDGASVPVSFRKKELLLDLFTHLD